MTITAIDASGRATATPVTEYDAHRRAQARAAGQPIERTVAPGIFGAMREGGTVDLVMVWTDENGSLACYCPTEDRAPTKVTINALDRALTLPPRDANAPDARHPDLETPRRLVVADHATLRRLMAWVKVVASTCPPDDHTPASVYRRLQVASRLVASTRLVILTRALARKFWLPSQYDPEDFGAWRRAFRYGSGATTVSVMKGLIDLASEGRVFGKWARDAFTSESFALQSAAYSGLRSAVAAFRRIENADTAARAILATDPLLTERGMLDGTLSRLRILNRESEHFTATVTTPFKLRAGKTILLIDPDATDPGEWAETALQAVTVHRMGDQDQLVVKVAATTRARTNLSSLLNRVTAAGASRALFVTEAPYLPFGTSDARASRWTIAAQDRIDTDRARPRRDIPLDVIVAGAPTA